MKRICLFCGDEIISGSQRKYYCSYECNKRMHNRRTLGISLEKDFDLFKHIVEASENAEEFYELYGRYFGGDDD